jgi:hypothetical protein
VIGQLGQRYPDTWGMIPKGYGNIGSSGLYSTGAMCGNPLGAFLVFGMMGAPTVLADNFLRWFENTYLPTNDAYVDYRSNTWDCPGGFGSAAPLNNAPKVKPLTTTCHGAHTRWKVAAQSWILAKGSTPANHDRCRKSTYASVFKMCQLINDWKAGVTITAQLDPSVAGCKVAGCHDVNPLGGAGGKMKCEPCHSTTAAIVSGHGM